MFKNLGISLHIVHLQYLQDISRVSDKYWAKCSLICPKGLNMWAKYNRKSFE